LPIYRFTHSTFSASPPGFCFRNCLAAFHLSYRGRKTLADRFRGAISFSRKLHFVVSAASIFAQHNTRRRVFTHHPVSRIKKDRNKRLPGTSKQPEDSRSPWDLRAPSSRGSAVFIKDVEFGDRPRSIEDRQHSKSSSRSPWSDRSLEAFASASAARDGDISRVTHSVNRLFAESSAFPAAASI
jgi:hypothetical protein